MDGRAWRDYSARQRRHAIAELRHHWGGAYEVTWTGGQFCARRWDTGALVRAGTAEALLEQVVQDYIAKAVPRERSQQS